ncbi:sensor histidine kinase [Microbacterium sp.]|uniref:sensor histidine kinase n=1 Tax=Microbacterium sp. TaxID=51671 RepID=UPI003A8EBAA5
MPTPTRYPSPPPDRPASAPAGLVGAIRVGQALITAVLVVVGAARALLDGRPAVGVVTLAVVFLAWYLGGLALAGRTRDRRLAAGWLAGLILLWVALILVSAEFVWLAFSLWLLAGFVLPLWWGAASSLGILVVVLAAPVTATGTTTTANVVGPVIGGLFAFGIARGYLELVRDGRERRALIASLVAAQNETATLLDELARTQRESGMHAERTRLSRDIHDTVAQSMTSIAMLARAAATGDDQARALGQIEQLARDGSTQVRRIVNALMPAELDGTALGDALARLLARLHDETGLQTQLHVDADFPALDAATEIVLLRTAQSALANVRTHAGATKVVMTLADAGTTARLDIADDGEGFDAARWELRAARAGDGGYGLRAARARLREHGGGLDVESAPGEGVAVSAYVPINDGSTTWAR